MSDDEARRYNVLFEHIDGKMTALHESVTVLIARADRTDSRFDHLETRFDRLELKVDAIADDVTVLKSDTAVLKSDMADVKGRLGRVEHHIGLNGAKRSKRKSTRKPKGKP